MPHVSRLYFALLSLASAALVSCGSAKPSYYVLTAEGALPSSGGGRGVGVGPVALASHLDRPNLIFQETDHRLSVSESHRWAGRLEENIANVLAADLGREMHTGNVRTYPWDSDSGLSYQIAVDIRHLEGTAEGDAIVEATWRIYSLPDRGLVTTHSWSGTEPLRHDGYDELVSAESRLLAKLAGQIAGSIKG